MAGAGGIGEYSSDVPNKIKVIKGVVKGKCEVVEVDLVEMVKEILNPALDAVKKIDDCFGMEIYEVSDFKMPTFKEVKERLYTFFQKHNAQVLESLSKELWIEVEEKTVSDDAKLPTRKPVGPGQGI